MKVTLDITKLLEEGTITKVEYDRFLHLSTKGTGSLAFNILVAFGIVAVAGALIALFPNAMSVLTIGGLIFILGHFVHFRFRSEWGLFGIICILIGTLLLSGSFIALTEGAPWTFLAITIILALSGVMTKSGLFIAASICALSSYIGVMTSYEHASYTLFVQRPLLTVEVFTALAIATYAVSLKLPADYERLAIIASRTSVMLVNFGLWVGSLWGDWGDQKMLFSQEAYAKPPLMLPGTFSFLWLVMLIGLAIWGTKMNRRWAVNTAAVFGAIHFYTQWFEHFGASPGNILLAGLLALGIAISLWKYNKAHA